MVPSVSATPTEMPSDPSDLPSLSPSVSSIPSYVPTVVPTVLKSEAPSNMNYLELHYFKLVSDNSECLYMGQDPSSEEDPRPVGTRTCSEDVWEQWKYLGYTTEAFSLYTLISYFRQINDQDFNDVIA